YGDLRRLIKRVVCQLVIQVGGERKIERVLIPECVSHGSTCGLFIYRGCDIIQQVDASAISIVSTEGQAALDGVDRKTQGSITIYGHVIVYVYRHGRTHQVLADRLRLGNRIGHVFRPEERKYTHEVCRIEH